jgi:hypothetical protein
MLSTESAIKFTTIPLTLKTRTTGLRLIDRAQDDFSLGSSVSSSSSVQ